MADDVYDSDGRFIPNFTPYFHDKLIQFQGLEQEPLSPEERETRLPAAYILTLVFGEIAWKCREYGVCWATQKYMAKTLGFSVKTVQRALGELVETDEIFMHHTRKGIRNVYTLDNASPQTVNKRLDGAAVSKTIRVVVEGVGPTVLRGRTQGPKGVGPRGVTEETRLTDKAEKNNTVASQRYTKKFSNKNDEYILEILKDERDLEKLKQGIIKEQKKRERARDKPIKNLDAFMLKAVRDGYWKSFFPGYDGAKETKKRMGETEDERLERFRQSAVQAK